MKNIETRTGRSAAIKKIIAKHKSLKDMAGITGYSIDTIKSWSSGRRVPSVETIRSILNRQ